MRNSPRVAPARFLLSLRLSLFLSFAVLSAITGALGLYASHTVGRMAELAVQIYDRSLMATNYARAAAADFETLKTAFIQRALATDPADRTLLNAQIAKISRELNEDLSVAAERAQSAQAARAVDLVRKWVNEWQTSWASHLDDGDPVEARDYLDKYARDADHELDLLVNYTAGDGFDFREQALASIHTQAILDLALTGGAMALSLLIAWPLGRRIVRPVSAASAAAGRIARGELSAPIPEGGTDELGQLLDSMRIMRDSIREMMEREVAQRRSAQARLIDAIENSREGVILVNAEGRVVVSNIESCTFFSEFRQHLRPEASFADFLKALWAEAMPAAGGMAPLQWQWPPQASHSRPVMVDLRTGRSVRISWSATGEGGIVVFCSDMTELKEREARLEQSNMWLHAALSNMSQGLCLVDSGGRVKVVNRRFREIFGLHDELELVGLTLDDAIRTKLLNAGLPENTVVPLLAERRRQLASGRPFHAHLPLPGGRRVDIMYEPMADGGWVATYEDATERYRSRERILFMARHDSLTGLPNRLLFTERLDEAFATTRAEGCFALLCIDLDHFKEVNDTLGHPIGDRLLAAVAQRFTGCARATDTVARLGGDEFATVITELRDPLDALVFSSRVIDVVREPFLIDGHRISIGASIGIAVAPQHGADRDTLMRNADIALYRAKSSGRNASCLFEPVMEMEAQVRRSVELELPRAISAEQLELHYQPIFKAETLELTGLEALLRWRHPVRGLLGAAEFIQIAEDSEQIDAIGAWVLRRACETAKQWPRDVRVAINVSPAQLRSDNFAFLVETVLKEARLPPERLELEVTERVLLPRNQSTLAMLQRIQHSGVAIAVDDFGTGYSSLSYLQHFSFDRIKIDQSFVRGLLGDQGASAIVRAIIDLGNNLGIPTTAEGVEEAQQLELLRAGGCVEVQGFLLGRPVPAEELDGLFAPAQEHGPVGQPALI
jgi:diguanylate cyclase (GGDEF)-like protein